ncbi:hypothetical protein J6590_049351 [Homalodisca vitripennis]|nr:hypothetical protein J6590_049351 [Homalodisca vitripennis]
MEKHGEPTPKTSLKELTHKAGYMFLVAERVPSTRLFYISFISCGQQHCDVFVLFVYNSSSYPAIASVARETRLNDNTVSVDRLCASYSALTWGRTHRTRTVLNPSRMYVTSEKKKNRHRLPKKRTHMNATKVLHHDAVDLIASLVYQNKIFTADRHRPQKGTLLRQLKKKKSHYKNARRRVFHTECPAHTYGDPYRTSNKTCLRGLVVRATVCRSRCLGSGYWPPETQMFALYLTRNANVSSTVALRFLQDISIRAYVRPKGSCSYFCEI